MARYWLFYIPILSSLIWVGSLEAGLFDRLRKIRNDKKAESFEKSGIQTLKDIKYGDHESESMDVYYPSESKNSPVIFMVHGGAWKIGDKSTSKVVDNKVNWYVKKGFIFISINYRLIPDAYPLDQAKDVSKALAYAQKNCHKWGGDSTKFILMGHSAGAHLVTLVSASPKMAYDLGAKPWLGTVSLDSAVYDVPKLMEAKHYKLYDTAFGEDETYWRSASPYHQLESAQSPILAVCTKREDSKFQSSRYIEKALQFDMNAKVLIMDMSHGEVNELLGKDEQYTLKVDEFLGSLDSSIKKNNLK